MRLLGMVFMTVFKRRILLSSCWLRLLLRLPGPFTSTGSDPVPRARDQSSARRICVQRFDAGLPP